jgi:hypothetical protein
MLALFGQLLGPSVVQAQTIRPSSQIALNQGDVTIATSESLFRISTEGIFAFSLQSGKLSWKHAVRLNPLQLSSSVAMGGQHIYVLSATGTVSFIDIRLGTVIRTVSVRKPKMEPSVIFANDENLIVVYTCPKGTAEQNCSAEQRVRALGINSKNGQEQWIWKGPLRGTLSLTSLGKKHILWYQNLTTVANPGAAGTVYHQRLPSQGRIDMTNFDTFPVSAEGQELETWRVRNAMVYVQKTPENLTLEIHELEKFTKTTQQIVLTREGCSATQVPDWISTFGQNLNELIVYIKSADSCGPFSMLWSVFPTPQRLDRDNLDPNRFYSFYHVGPSIWARAGKTPQWFRIDVNAGGQPSLSTNLPVTTSSIAVVGSQLLVCRVTGANETVVLIDAKTFKVRGVIPIAGDARIEPSGSNMLLIGKKVLAVYNLAPYLK